MTKEEFEKQINNFMGKHIEEYTKKAMEKKNYQLIVDPRKMFLEENNLITLIKVSVLLKDLMREIGYDFENENDVIVACANWLTITSIVKEENKMDFDYDLIIIFPNGYKKIINFNEQYNDCIKLGENEETMESDLIN